RRTARTRADRAPGGTHPAGTAPHARRPGGPGSPGQPMTPHTLFPAPAGTLPTPGTVTLVGAGPGDPELLTIKAARAIGAASVLLVDDLVGDGVLAYASPEARIVHVGKRGGCKSTPQAFIEKLMI